MNRTKTLATDLALPGPKQTTAGKAPSKKKEVMRHVESTASHSNADEKDDFRRYNLSLPTEVYDELQMVAAAHKTNVVTLLRKFIKLGLLAVKLEDTEDGAVIFRENGVDRQIIIV